MGNCTHCGQPAGFLRSVHRECADKARAASVRISALAAAALRDGGDFIALRDQVLAIGAESQVAKPQQQKLVAAAWVSAVDAFLDDGLLSEAEERSLVACKSAFLLSDADVDASGALTRTVKAAVLRELLEGKIPERIVFDSAALGLNLQKTEQVVWAFPGTEYLEDKTRRQYVGGSQGVSIRIAKGLYYRTGAFKGHSISTLERVSHGKGMLVVTTKHLYFTGSKSFRIPLQKIVSYEAFSDGVGIMRDAQTAKPQVFITGDGWFTYNLLQNVSAL